MQKFLKSYKNHKFTKFCKYRDIKLLEYRGIKFPSALRMQPLGVYKWCCEKIVFVTTTKNLFVGLFVKWVRFLTLLWEYIFF